MYCCQGKVKADSTAAFCNSPLESDFDELGHLDIQVQGSMSDVFIQSEAMVLPSPAESVET